MPTVSAGLCEVSLAMTRVIRRGSDRHLVVGRGVRAREGSTPIPRKVRYGRHAIRVAWGDVLVSALLALTAACVLFLAGCSADAAARGTVSSALDNGTIRVGIDLNAGGAISYLSQSGSSYNLVNTRDRGRYVQQSYYAGQDLDRSSEGQNRLWSPWPWNPVQGGDTYGNTSPVLAWINDGYTIYVRT